MPGDPFGGGAVIRLRRPCRRAGFEQTGEGRADGIEKRIEACGVLAAMRNAQSRMAGGRQPPEIAASTRARASSSRIRATIRPRSAIIARTAEAGTKRAGSGLRAVAMASRTASIPAPASRPSAVATAASGPAASGASPAPSSRASAGMRKSGLLVSPALTRRRIVRLAR